MMNSDYAIQEFTPNLPQLRNIMAKPRGGTHIWGRGTGKSTDMAWLIKTIIEEMPRSLWNITGRTFTDILKNTLPTTIGALEDLGYIRGKDFFIGRKAPEHWQWPEPYRPPLDPKHVIWTRTGTAFVLTSQDREDANRGANFDGVICDEGLNMIRERFERETIIANRSGKKQKARFKDCPLHHGVFIYTSRPYTAEGRWLEAHGEYYNDIEDHEALGRENDAINRKLIKLQLELIDTPDTDFRKEKWRQIKILKSKLRYYKNKLGFLYSESNIFDNVHNLGFKYVLQLRKQLLDITFRIEVLNERLKLLEKSFYPCLNEEKHFYSAYNYSSVDEALGDEYNLANIKEHATFDINPQLNYDPHRPLEIGVDFGALINWIVVSQDYEVELRIIKSLYVKTPKILDHVFENFCEYYSTHHERTVYFHYDPATGNARKDNSILTAAEQAAQVMRKHDWDVRMMTTWGANIFHEEKYQMINKILLEDTDELPVIRLNKDNNKDLIISLNNTGIKENYKGFKKDKSSETRKSMKNTREHASDGSDAFDILLWGKYKDMWELLNTGGSFSDITIG